MVQSSELEKKTVAQLKEIAKEMGITGLSKMKKDDLIAAIQDNAAGAETAPIPEPAPEAEPVEVEAAEEAPAEEPVAEEPVAEEAEPVAEEAPAEEPVAEEPVAEEAEPVAEEAPAEEPAAEEPVAEEAVAEEAEPVAEEAPAEPVKAKEPKPEKPKVIEKPPTKIQLKVRAKYDLAALKTEKKAIKGQIADAIETKDSAKVKELRTRKKEIRRILKKAS